MTNDYATENGLADADWAQSHANDPNVRLVEVDVDATAYEQSHNPGAIAWNWTSQLADGIRRDIASREDFSKLAPDSRDRPGHHDRAVRGQQQLVRRVGSLIGVPIEKPVSRGGGRLAEPNAPGASRAGRARIRSGRRHPEATPDVRARRRPR